MVRHHGICLLEEIEPETRAPGRHSAAPPQDNIDVSCTVQSKIPQYENNPEIKRMNQSCKPSILLLFSSLKALAPKEKNWEVAEELSLFLKTILESLVSQHLIDSTILSNYRNTNQRTTLAKRFKFIRIIITDFFLSIYSYSNFKLMDKILKKFKFHSKFSCPRNPDVKYGKNELFWHIETGNSRLALFRWFFFFEFLF